MQLIDTHAHLHTSPFDADRPAVLARASAAGVTTLIEIGYDLPSSHAAIALAEQTPGMYAVVGVQPNHAADLPNDWLAQVECLSQHRRVVAIGEIGFDFYWKKATYEQQEQVFLQQLALARSRELPVVIHSREAHVQTLQTLRAAAHGVVGIMHSFSGDWEYAQACLDLGFYLSFSGPLTYKKATDIQAVVRAMPLDRMLSETDSPYLAPHPLRGSRNEPANVRLVVEQIAALRQQPIELIALAIRANAARLFRLEE